MGLKDIKCMRMGRGRTYRQIFARDIHHIELERTFILISFFADIFQLVSDPNQIRVTLDLFKQKK